MQDTDAQIWLVIFSYCENESALMDKIARQLNNVGLDLKEIEVFLVWYKSKKYNIKTLKQDILSPNSNTLHFFKTKLPSKQYAFYILKHTLRQKQDEYAHIKHHINCSMVNCASLHRIIDALKYYKTLFNNNNKNDIIFKQLLIKYFEKKYKHLISDFHHILSAHLNQPKLIHLQNYDMIYTAICKNKLKCNIHSCQQYKRYHHNRQQLYHNRDHKVTLYQDLMDTVHTYFVHAFDDGSRLNITELTSMKQTTVNYDDITDETSIPFKDDNLKGLQRILCTKKDFIYTLRGKDRMDYHKFNNDSVNEEKKNDDIASNTCIGMHYYYWDYYKKKEEEDRVYHAGDSFSDWFIPHKYDTFKQEMLCNKIYCVDVHIWNYVLYKATVLIKQSDFIQSIKSSMAPIYNIQEDYKITVDIVIALIFYTDFDRLRYAFMQTFKRLNDAETDKQLKDRHAEFCFLSKIIVETVECYGTQLIDQKLEVFYTAFMHKLLFKDTSLMFCGPISCTPHVEVATIYTDSDGIILELCASNYSLKLFKCCYVSSFALEEEVLFCGGRKPLEIHSIIHLKENENYRVFIKAIGLFIRLMDGKSKWKATNMDYFIMHCLIKHKMEVNVNTFPKYINDIFDGYCRAQTFVRLDLKSIMSCYAGFSLLFLSSKHENLVLFDKIAKLFINCRNIMVRMTDHGIITSEYLMLLLKCVNKVNRIANVRLNKIDLMDVELQCDDKELEEYKSSLQVKGWKSHTQHDKNQCNLIITCI